MMRRALRDTKLFYNNYSSLRDTRREQQNAAVLLLPRRVARTANIIIMIIITLIMRRGGTAQMDAMRELQALPQPTLRGSSLKLVW